MLGKAFFDIVTQEVCRKEEELAQGKVRWIRVDDLHAELKKLHPWL